MKTAILASIFSALYFGAVIKMFGSSALKPAYIVSQLLLGIFCLLVIKKIKKDVRRKVWKSKPDWEAIDQRYQGIQSVIQGKSISFNEVVKRCLSAVENEASLVGDQFFCIIFEKKSKGVEISPDLPAENASPKFINLELGPEEFKITRKDESHLAIKMRINSKIRTFTIPYDAIRTFADPSVGFAITRQSPIEW